MPTAPLRLQLRRLRALRIQRQLSQAKLAELAGLSQPVVFLAESGWGTGRTLARLAAVLGCEDDPKSLFDEVLLEEVGHASPTLVMEKRDA